MQRNKVKNQITINSQRMIYRSVCRFMTTKIIFMQKGKREEKLDAIKEDKP